MTWGGRTGAKVASPLHAGRNRVARHAAPHERVGATGLDHPFLDRSAFTQRLRITAPADITVNSTGVLTAESEKDGRKTWTWESDYPLRVFNVAAARWAVKKGPGTAVYYHPGHAYNVDSLLEALNGARRYFAEWYGPFPWRELRLNEFPAFAGGARGNATNIFFSESTGFLVKPQPGNDMAFSIAAHEAAHSWWGHIMQSGEGPGGIVLAGAVPFDHCDPSTTNHDHPSPIRLPPLHRA